MTLVVDGHELAGEMPSVKPKYSLVIGLMLLIWAPGVVAQQAVEPDQPDQPADRAEGCRIGVDEMENFRRTRRLTKSC